MDYRKTKRQGPCEDCEFFDYDEDYDMYSCHMNMDQDDLARYTATGQKGCPYFRYYNEYKSTQNQI